MKARASRFWAWASHQTVLFAAVVALAAVASSAAAGWAPKPGTVEPRTVTVPRSVGPLATKKLADEVGRGLPAPTQPAMGAVRALRSRRARIREAYALVESSTVRGER